MSPPSPEKPAHPKVADNASALARTRVLEPMDRIIEVFCGLIMVLTFTLAADLTGRKDVHTMLIAAIGCNIAWGIVDGAMYLMANLSERASGVRALRAVQKAGDPETGRGIISKALPAKLASILTPEELEVMRHRLCQLPEPPARARLTRKAWLGAAAVFLLVFLSTFPVVIPFVFVSDFAVARRASNLVAIAMLFATGYAYGRCSGYRPVWIGLSMVLFGSILVGVTIVLGG